LVIAGQVGTDDLPRLSAVCRDVHELAADINAVVIVRGDHQRELPVEAVFHFRGGGARGLLGPNLDIAGLVVALAEIGDDAAAAAGAGGARPDEIGVHG